MKKKELKLTIAIPTYNGEQWIGQTLRSVFSQSFQEFEIIIVDDCSRDNTLGVIKKFKDKRIRIYQNKKNLGYGKNLQVLEKLVKGEILFLLGQDDLLLEDALLKTYQAFLLNEEIGTVTRPYYWFDQDPKKPVRAVFPYDREKDRVLSIFDGKREVEKIFESAGQLSGLAYRTKYLTTGFGQETFTAHVYPLASILKKHKIVFLKDYTVAVRIPSSQTRFKASIYEISPTESWVKMFQSIYQGAQYQEVRKTAIRQIATHFIGLVQIKNYGSFKNLLREILVLIKVYPFNLLNPKFWFFSLGTILVPRKILTFLVDNYKNKILARRLRL